MAQRTIEKRPTLRQFMEFAQNLKSKEEREAWARKAVSMYDPLEIYDCNDFTSGINKQCVDSLVRTAMRKSYCSEDYPLRLAATWMLAKGWLVWTYAASEEYEDADGRIVRDWDTDRWVLKDPHDVESVRFVNGELRELTIHYIYTKGGESRPGYPPADGEDWEYRAIYTYSPLLDMQQLEVQRYPVDSNVTDPKAEVEVVELPVWPFRGVQWYTRDSFITPVISTILRYEVCLRNIAHENDRHTRRVKHNYGVGKMQETIDDQVADGEVNMPPGSKSEYPDTHPEGLEPMFKEREVLEDEIRQTLGIIKVKELHNASGVSREIEIAPLLSQCEAMRDAIKQIVGVIDAAAVVHFGPLQELNPQELEIYLRSIRSLWIDGVLNDEEYTLKQRLAVDLPERPVRGGPVTANREQAQLQLMKPSTRQAV